ncbi:MAG: glycoside hydrolase family 6 protein [Candidatus Microsaccharimonas sp.]
MKQKFKKTLPFRTVSKLLFGLFLLVLVASAVTYTRVVLAATQKEHDMTALSTSDSTTPETKASATKDEVKSDTQQQKDEKKSTTTQDTTTPAAPATAPTPTTPTYSPITSPSPRGMDLYVDPSLAQAGRPETISSQAVATWLGDWSGDVQSIAASKVSAAVSQNKLAVLVAYNIPGRDCGSYSAGGSASADSYKAWIRQLAAGIGQNKAIVILEPDALAQIDCLSPTDQASRYSLLADAVNVLATQTKAFIYIDAGHSKWISAGTMADRLKKANISQARGFSLNISNFISTNKNTVYGNSISAATGKTFVIDTSRNGNDANGEWCNPRGRALGASPTTSVGGNVDAYLWVKVPGESDGNCNSGPSAGVWWEEYAQELIVNRK